MRQCRSERKNSNEEKLWILGFQSPSAVAAPSTRHVEAPNTPTAELHVCPNGCAYSSVQAAVDVAGDDDVIKVAAGTYTGVDVRPRDDFTTTGVVTQVVYISKTVAIQGGYTTTNWTTPDPEANPTTLDAEGQGRVFYITGDISTTIEGLRITGGDANVFPNTEWGSNHGGGMFIISATMTIRGNWVYGNMATLGGGIALLMSDNALLSDNTISTNISNFIGGGLVVDSSDNITIQGNTFTANTSNDYSGGLHVYETDTNLFGNTFTGNTAGEAGGGLTLVRNDSTLSGNIVSDNTASGTGAGGVFVLGGAPTFINNVITDNSGEYGSALLFEYSSARLLHNTIARNIGVEPAIFAMEGWLGPSNIVMTNTILVNHTIGIHATSGNTITLNATLWHANGMNHSGNVIHTNDYSGDPAFATDGYHITPASTAMDTGINAGVTGDIDSHHRPYNAPDLGADEVIATSVPTDTESTLIYTDTEGSPTVIQVPGGAVTTETTLVYTPVETATAPSGFSFVGHAFDLDAYRNGEYLSDFTFEKPVTITLYYSDVDVAGLDESSLELEYWNENTSLWEDATCGVYDRRPDENWLAVPICHLSQFALIGESEYLIYLPLVLHNDGP